MLMEARALFSRMQNTTTATSPSGANSSAWGLISTASAKLVSEGTYRPSAASSAHRAIISVNTESICPHAAESVNAAGLRAKNAASISAARAPRRSFPRRQSSHAPARSKAMGHSFSRSRYALDWVERPNSDRRAATGQSISIYPGG